MSDPMDQYSKVKIEEKMSNKINLLLMLVNR